MKKYSCSSFLLPLSFLLLLAGTIQKVLSQQSDSRDGAGPAWSYDEEADNGPSDWYENYPICGQHSQSPIDIEISEAVYRSEMTHLTFTNYENPSQSDFKLKNTGKSIQIDVNGVEEDIYISGGNLANKYFLHQLHFHWGQDPTVGSEHLIDGKAFSMEIHFVHWNEKYGSFDNASNITDGLAVVGVFVQADNDLSLSAPELVNLTSYFDDIQNAGNETSISSFSLNSLLPSERTYYRYQGSLTTPGCYESVTWTVYRAPTFLTEATISQFQTVLDSHGHQISYNYRPEQDLNDRPIYTNLQPTGGQSSVRPPVLVTMILAGVIRLAISLD